MKKVLVTGATGFIGRHCLPILNAKGYEVHAISYREAQLGLSDVHWHRANLLTVDHVVDLMARVKPTHLLHLAWVTTPGEYWSSLKNHAWIQASLCLMEAFAAIGGRRIVVAGTCAEYDWSYGYCSEQTTPLVPLTLYGACKHALYVILRTFARQAGLDVAWGRLFFLYGPHEHPVRLVPTVIHSLLRSETARFSHGNQIRDFLFVQDAADAFVTLLESDICAPVNIASGHPIALRDVIRKVAEKLDRQDLVHLGARPASVNDPPFLVANVDRLKNEVGWFPKFDLDRGLDQTISWWRSQLSEEKRDTTY